MSLSFVNLHGESITPSKMEALKLDYTVQRDGACGAVLTSFSWVICLRHHSRCIRRTGLTT